MTTTLTNINKTSVTLTLTDKPADTTWDAATYTWDEAEGTWNVPGVVTVATAKTTVTLTATTKN